MNFWHQILQNEVLLCAIIGWLVAQVLKVVVILLKEKRFDLGRFIGSGGMPSSHSAFVSSMATAAAIHEGLDSTAFAISFVLAFVVMYDAAGVRKAAGEQAKVINLIQKSINETTAIYLKELLGHTFSEVLAGCALGIVISLFMLL
ncbi:MAG: divergent PAP2 family protein [Bacillota bacterium]|nr:divergent PAP2 family protein [Bacillota bacterium]